MKAEIISTGTELLLGEIVDTNTSFIAGQLAMLGIDLYYTSMVGDNYDRLLGVLRQAWQRSDIIILTGGLGPTQGDITREVIGGLLGEKPEVDAGLKQELINYFSRVGMEMAQNNIKQATLIPSATAIPNRRGTAPGWWVEKDGRVIVAMPGPPAEMQAMWQGEVLPRLQEKAPAIILSRTIKIVGLSESRVDELVSPLLSSANPTLAIYAKPDGIHLRITAKATDRDMAASMISGREADIRAILKDFIWGTDSDTLEGVVAQLLTGRKVTLAVAESFSGGFLSYTLATPPESRGYFKGGLIATSDQFKSLLGAQDWPPGPASPETAAAMARGVRTRFDADIGIGLDGYAGLDGGLAAGTAFIAVDAGPGREVLTQTYRSRPQQMVRRATNQTLFKLRAILLSL